MRSSTHTCVRRSRRASLSGVETPAETVVDNLEALSKVNLPGRINAGYGGISEPVRHQRATLLACLDGVHVNC